MKYEVSVTINKGIDEVLEKFQDRDAAFEWITGLTKFELIEGELGKEKSKYLMEFTNEKGKKSTMKETIEVMNPPLNITTIYEAGSVWNRCENIFKGHDDHTHYKMITEFKFPWYMGFMGFLFKKMFVKESLKGLNAFKEYAERE